MITAHAAESIILDRVQPFDRLSDTEIVDLWAASGRVLADTVTSQLDFPHWDNSAMDGYAVRFQDVTTACPNAPVQLEIVEEVPAGYAPQRSIESGQAARILTGSMLPVGADTVVMQEHTQREGNRVTILACPRARGAFVRHRATYYRAGDPLLTAGLKLTAAEIAVLAAAQCTQVKVYRRPRVAILSTGSELIAPNQVLQLGQIVDSNQYALASLISQAGAEPLPLGIVSDHPQTLRQAIAQASQQADVILSSGGVSVGDYDYVEPILTELGADICIRSVAIRPGKPLTVATLPSHSSASPLLYMGLPGNPAAVFVTFWRFVQPALKKLSGLSENWFTPLVKACTQEALHSDGTRETYLWGELQLIDGRYHFQPAKGGHSSGNLINLTKSNGLAVLPIGETQIPAGEFISVMQIN